MKKILLILLLVPAFAYAEKWKYLGDSPELGMEMSADEESIVVLKNGNRKVWLKTVFAKPMPTTSGDTVYRRNEALWHFNCAERTSFQTQYIRFDSVEYGKIVDSATRAVDENRFEDVPPGSFKDSAMKFVCNSGRK